MTIITKKIPNGYKQTEIGVIPVDWCLKRLDEIFRITAGRDLVKNSFSQTKDQGHPFPVYSNSLQDYGLYGYTKIARHRENTITITARGTLGRANARYHKYDAIGRLLILEPLSNVNCFFMSEYLNNRVQFSIESTSVPQLTAPQVSKYFIAYPDSVEQNAIATALSDIDALIKKTESLIEKKKAIKQGAMQELPTGKRRLPGFGGEWEESPISQFTWFQEGPGVRTEQFTSSGVKLLNGTNIYKGKLLLDNTNRFISEAEAFGPYSHFLVDEGDIVIASSGITVDKFEEKISFVKESHLPLCMNTSTIRFKILNHSMDPLFLYYFFMSKKFKNQIGAQATGSAQLNFGPSHLQKVDIYLPKDPREQTAIASILSDMDTEIEKLESELTKWRDMKQGMMQTLLTGKIRLIK